MEFKEKLQNLRKHKGLSQEKLAEIIGVSRQAVSKWESGSSYPETDKIILLCELFSCSMDELLKPSTTIQLDSTITKEHNITTKENPQDLFSYQEVDNEKQEYEEILLSDQLLHIEIQTTMLNHVYVYSTKQEHMYLKLSDSTKKEIDSDIKLVIRNSKKRLSIAVRKKGVFNFIGFNGKTKNLDLVIYLPEKYTEALEINTICDHVIVDSVKLSEFEINSTNAILDLNNIVVNQMEIHGVSRELKIVNLIGDLEINSVSANIALTYLEFEHNLEINSVASTVRIDLPKGSEYIVKQNGVNSTARYYIDDVPTDCIKSNIKNRIEIAGVNTELILNEYTK